MKEKGLASIDIYITHMYCIACIDYMYWLQNLEERLRWTKP